MARPYATARFSWALDRNEFIIAPKQEGAGEGDGDKVHVLDDVLVCDLECVHVVVAEEDWEKRGSNRSRYARCWEPPPPHYRSTTPTRRKGGGEGGGGIGRREAWVEGK